MESQKSKVEIKRWVATVIFVSVCNIVLSQPPIWSSSSKLLHPVLVNKFYNLNHQQAFWFTSSASSSEIRSYFLQVIDSSKKSGLNREKYHYSEIKNNIIPKDSVELMKLDRIFTDAVIAYSKDLYQGTDIHKWISNDEVSGKYATTDDEYILNNILKVNSVPGLNNTLLCFEPNEIEYSVLKIELKKQLASNNTIVINQLYATINLYRWIHHFHFDKFIVVNIPSATLRYYERDNMKLQMKVVVGKPSTKSPRFSTWCYQVVLYPYWNVPADIGLKELLPRFKKHPASLDAMNMQVLGKNGKVIDHHGIDWSEYNRGNFPYSFRQCTGCDNSLGVIKFNLTDPFSVYLHDTNFKLAFLKDRRFLSHGCIRVEKPIELGNYLLNNKIDSNFLKACYKDLEPMPMNLEKRVPVFVVYMPLEANADSIVYYKDIYRLFR